MFLISSSAMSVKTLCLMQGDFYKIWGRLPVAVKDGEYLSSVLRRADCVHVCVCACIHVLLSVFVHECLPVQVFVLLGTNF